VKKNKEVFLIFAGLANDPPNKEMIDEGVRLGLIDPGAKPHSMQLASPAEVILRWARRGDWDFLAEYILHGEKITDDMREFLAAVLQRRVKKPNNRAPSLQKWLGGPFARVQFFISLVDGGLGRERAVGLTAEKFGIDRRSVRRDLKEGEDAARLLIVHRQVQQRYSRR
jgi:hypothetical protein